MTTPDPQPTSAPPTRSALSVPVMLIGLILVVASVAALVLVLQDLPDQKALMTPEAVEGAPAWAADVEAKVAAADPTQGSVLFQKYGCIACHGPSNTGPGLLGLGKRAATRRPGYSAPVYLYESITEPNAFVVPDYPAGVMVQNFKASVPEEDLYTLVAWLLKQ